MSRIGQGIKKSVLTANSVLYAVTASIPAALSMAASRILGRKSSGNVAAMTVAELLTLIGVETGATADQTGAEMVTLLEALGSGSQLSHDQLDDVSTSDHHTKYTDANARAAAVSDAIYGAGWNGVTTIAPSKNAVYDKIETLGVLSSKVKNDTRNMTAASGDVSYTGYGFRPTTLECVGSIDPASTTASIGFADSARASGSILDLSNDTWSTDTVNFIHLRVGVTPDDQRATISSYDADGFTLTWIKRNNPTGLAYLAFRAMR